MAGYPGWWAWSRRGPGTPVGDPRIRQSLAEVYGQRRPRAGTVKTTGHTQSLER